MKALIGTVINKLLISANDEILVFATDEGLCAYETTSDWGYGAWFDSITGVEALLGQDVLGHKAIKMPTSERREYKGNHYIDKLQHYGEKLRTCKGFTHIVYRNS